MTRRISRRDVLKMLGAVAMTAPCEALAQPRDAGRPDPGPTPAPTPGPPPAPAPTYLRVSVHQPGGDHLEAEASVTLQDAQPVVLRRTRPRATYETVVTPGAFAIACSASMVNGVNVSCEVSA